MRRQGRQSNFNEQFIARSAEGLFAKRTPKKTKVNTKEAGEARFNTPNLSSVTAFIQKQSFLLNNHPSLSLAEEPEVTVAPSEHQDSEEQNGNKII